MTSANTKFNFTKRALEALRPDEGAKQIYYRDTQTRGLCLSVAKGGTKTFCLYRKIQGRPERVLIGQFPAISIEQARAKADELNSAIAAGRNPAAEVTAIKGELTVGDLFREYIERHAKKKKTWQEMERSFKNHAGTLASMQLSNVSSAHANRLHSDIGKDVGVYAANRMVQMFKAVFNKGRLWKLYSGDNPFDGITLFTETPRERFLSDEETSQLLKAIERNPNEHTRDFITLSLFTGIRKANLAALEWSWIDLKQGTLRVPHTKNGTSHTTGLGASELAILKRRREQNPDGEFVFPGTGKAGHIMDVKRSWNTLRKDAKLEDVTIHDLRRSLAASMANANINIALVKSAMNHKDIKTTLAVYARTQASVVREARELVQAKWLMNAQEASDESDSE
jgi:integrase